MRCFGIMVVVKIIMKYQYEVSIKYHINYSRLREKSGFKFSTFYDSFISGVDTMQALKMYQNQISLLSKEAHF